MPTIHTFEFALRDQVSIKELNRPATIEAMSLDSMGPQYRVAFWADGNRKTAWVYAFEIELREDQDRVHLNTVQHAHPDADHSHS
jgi:lipocalin